MSSDTRLQQSRCCTCDTATSPDPALFSAPDNTHYREFIYYHMTTKSGNPRFRAKCARPLSNVKAGSGNETTSYHDQLLRAGTGHKRVGGEVTRGQTGKAPGQPGILEGEEAWQEVSLIGLLSHACKAIRPGRSFLSRLIDLSMTVRVLSRPIRLNTSARSDMEWWGQFCETWNDGCQQGQPRSGDCYCIRRVWFLGLWS